MRQWCQKNADCGYQCQLEPGHPDDCWHCQMTGRAKPGTVLEPHQPPEHIVQMLTVAVHVPNAQTGPPGSIAYRHDIYATARAYAERIWAEAWHAGGAWGLARNTNLKVEVTAEQFAGLKPGPLATPLTGART